MACIVSSLVFVLWLLCLQRTVSKTTLAGQDSVNTASHETDKLMDVSLFEFLSHSFLRQSWSQLCMVSFLANSSYLDILKQVKGWILKWNKKKFKKTLLSKAWHAFWSSTMTVPTNVTARSTHKSFLIASGPVYEDLPQSPATGMLGIFHIVCLSSLCRFATGF